MYIWPSDMKKEIARLGINYILAGSWNEQGIKDWWNRPRYQLGGLTPQKVFDNGGIQEVIDLADSGRDCMGT